LLSTFVVTSIADSGPGTLRQAILDSNASAGPNTITFDLQGSTTIMPTSPLPRIVNDVIIDGFTQPGYAGHPLVVLDGSNAGNSNSYGGGTPGLNLFTGGTGTIRGLAIDNWTGPGILVLEAGDPEVISGNYIGTDASGKTAAGNGIGIDLFGSAHDTIGGTVASAGNLIVNNHKWGVVLAQAFNSQIVDNVISGNTLDGILIQGSGNSVQGNLIGTDPTGSTALGNGIGVAIEMPSNTIGGSTAAARNIISGNTNCGVELLALASTGEAGNDNLIEGNYIGTNANGNAAVPNYDGVVIGESFGSTVGGTLAGAGNLISGNTNYGVAIFSSPIDTNGQNLIVGNHIGTDAAGNAAVPNRIGVVVSGTPDNTVGGTSPAARNLISGNAVYGIIVTSSNANTVSGNYIGVNVGGTAALSNGVGIDIVSSGDNTIGGTETGAGNLISGNFWYGVQIAGGLGNLVEGNLIGLSANQSNALSSKIGVFVQNSSNNTIGGTTSGAGNIIAEDGWGVRISGGTGNAIQGNSIFGNTVLGIQLLNGGNNNQPAPVLSSATNAGGITTVSGTLTAAANTTYTLEFFWTPAHYATGADVQGKTFLLRVQVTTNANGVATFSIPLPLQVPAGDFVTATATDPNDDTSQFSNGVQVS
jgi:titin